VDFLDDVGAVVEEFCCCAAEGSGGAASEGVVAVGRFDRAGDVGELVAGVPFVFGGPVGCAVIATRMAGDGLRTRVSGHPTLSVPPLRMRQRFLLRSGLVALYQLCRHPQLSHSLFVSQVPY
jgi:hypothetical protein